MKYPLIKCFTGYRKVVIFLLNTHYFQKESSFCARWKLLPVKYFFLAAISGHMDLGAPGVSGVEDL